MLGEMDKLFNSPRHFDGEILFITFIALNEAAGTNTPNRRAARAGSSAVAERIATEA